MQMAMLSEQEMRETERAAVAVWIAQAGWGASAGGAAYTAASFSPNGQWTGVGFAGSIVGGAVGGLSNPIVGGAAGGYIGGLITDFNWSRSYDQQIRQFNTPGWAIW